MEYALESYREIRYKMVLKNRDVLRFRLFGRTFFAIIFSNSLNLTARFWHHKCDLARLSRYAVTYLQDSDIGRSTNKSRCLFYTERTLYYIIFVTVTVLVKRLNYPLIPFSFFYKYMYNIYTNSKEEM